MLILIPGLKASGQIGRYNAVNQDLQILIQITRV